MRKGTKGKEEKGSVTEQRWERWKEEGARVEKEVESVGEECESRSLLVIEQRLILFFGVSPVGGIMQAQ